MCVRTIWRWLGLVALGVLVCVTRQGPSQAFVEFSSSTVTPAATGAVRVYADQVTIETYNYDDYLYSQYNSTYNMHYQCLDWNSYGQNKRKEPRTYETIVMENAYLKLTIIPSLGGRIYSYEFKPTGHNEFYSNPVIKPTHWGPPEQGWWLAAGGMEWCLPVEEHGYEWGVSWKATTHADTDGVTVVLTDTAKTDRLRAKITLHLPNDRAYLAVTPRLENPTAGGISYKYWTNVQVAPGPLNTLSADFHFVLPIDQVTVHSTGDNRLPGPRKAMSWPVYKGLDWSRLGTWDQWLGFFARPAAARDFQGVYDTQVDEGLVRVFPAHVVRGAKGFAWGWNKRYPAINWTNRPTTYYAEVHGGIAPTFWDTTYLPPGGAIEWTEIWYPVAGIGGLTTATAKAALSLQVSGAQVTIGAQPTVTQTEGTIALWRPGETEPLHRQVITLTPALPHKTTLTPGDDLTGLVLAYLDKTGTLLATTSAAPDARPPSAHVHALPPYVTSPADLAVSWSGSDMETCVLYYDVQVKDGHDGIWTNWLTHTQAISATYPGGEDGHTYFFRCRARDLLGNVGGYGDDEWGQAFSSLLTSPAAVLVTSRKWSNRRGAIGGDVLTYTLSVRNTGNAHAAGVWITDTLPAEVVLITDSLHVSDDSSATAADGRILWNGPVTTGHTVDVTFAVQVHPDIPLTLLPVYNTMNVEHQETAFVRQTSFVLAHRTFFPLVFRHSTP